MKELERTQHVAGAVGAASAPDHKDPTGVESEQGACDRDPGCIWNVPNQLTVARLILSLVFFVLLALGNHGKTFNTLGEVKINLVLNASLVVFILAVVTDFLDGYLARKWHLVSTFGRIADPFADKVVICGGFIMLTGVTPRMVEPWYAVVIVTREFLVSGLRSFLESRGVPFGASRSGKVKMLVQSITIPLVIFYQANLADAAGGPPSGWLPVCSYWIAVAFLALTLLLTVTSSLSYIRKATALLRTGAVRR